MVQPIRFFRRSGARSNLKENGRQSLQRVKASRLSIEPLEVRRLLACDPFPTLTINIPPEVANLGVYAGFYSNGNHLYLSSSGHLSPIVYDTTPGAANTINMICLATAGSAPTLPVTQQLAIPAGQDLKSGDLVLYVGTSVTTLPINSSSQIVTPSGFAPPTTLTTVGNFGMIEFNYQQQDGGGTAGLDVDCSTVNTTGFPLTIVYPPNPYAVFPANAVGITLSQQQLVTDYQAAFEQGGIYAAHPEYLQCATYAQQQDPAAQQLVAPQEILAAEANPPSATLHLVPDPSSSLTPGTYYYYVVTAYSNNVISGSGGVKGETVIASGEWVSTGNTPAEMKAQVTWGRYYDPNTAGYRVYRWQTTSSSTLPDNNTVYSLLAEVSGATTLSIDDDGTITPDASKTISVNSSTGYGFNPLSAAYTSAIQDFFSHYSTANSFSIVSNGITWQGNTTTYTPSWGGGATYTVLQLTAQDGSGDIIRFYQPIFTTNTLYAGATAAAPSWLPNGKETPGQMVFGCDGVFVTGGIDPDSKDVSKEAAALANIGNCISAAFNRGLATNYSVHPDNWAAFPQITGEPTVRLDPASHVQSTTTYYYVVTAVNSNGETTPSLEVRATLAAGESATLNWKATPSTPTQYNIYRGTTPDNLSYYDHVAGTVLTYTDEGGPAASGSAPPYRYFDLTSGTVSNWYAGFVTSNSLVKPSTGVSLNGLSYGFPYSDQGSVSTNVQFPATSIPTNITINLGSQTGPSFVTQTLTDAVAGTSYLQDLLVGGSGTGTTFAIVGAGALPTGITLTAVDANTGRFSGTTSQTGVFSFDVKVTNSVGTVVMPYTLTVDPSGVAEVSVAVSPSSISGSTTSSMAYTFVRTGATTSPLTVSFTVGGTAAYQTIYTQTGAVVSGTSGTVTIPAGASSARVTVTPTGAKIVHDQTVIFTVIAGADYAVGSPSSAAGTILANNWGSTLGLYNNAAGTAYLRNENTSGSADITFQFGPAGSDWIPIAGDWDHDGICTLGLYDQSGGMVYLRNENTSGIADVTFQFGPAGNDWIPIAGDWNHDGVTTVGLYDQAGNTVYLRNENTSGFADITYQYGPGGNNWLPIAGDWDHNGDSTLGLYDRAANRVYLRNENTTGMADVIFEYGPAGNNWMAIAGDWERNGESTVGLYDRAVNTAFLRNENTTGFADITFQYGPGANNWTPIAGNWIPASTGTNALTAASNTADSVATTSLVQVAQTELDTIASEAIRRWQASGIDAAATATLKAARMELANLTAPKLAVIEDGVIYLDRTAAGHGWFIDPTPSSDEEFSATAEGVAMHAKSSSEAVDHIDLLTVVEQELGELAGLANLADCVIHDQIGTGIRSSLLAAS
jgi:hypothetical protein